LFLLFNNIFLQAVWVFTVSLPVIFVNAPSSATKLNPDNDWTPQDIVGAIFFVVGLLCEAFADITLVYYVFRFNQVFENKWSLLNIKEDTQPYFKLI
jgi:steroid 5-alpha reductase family enzyme